MLVRRLHKIKDSSFVYINKKTNINLSKITKLQLVDNYYLNVVEAML